VGFSVGGRHIWFVYSGGAISLTGIGRSHFWGLAAKMKCVQVHQFGWSLVLLIYLPGGETSGNMGSDGGLVVCVLGFELALGVAFLCRGSTIILLLEGLFIDCQNKGHCVWVYDFLKHVQPLW
jgi:hypothetical protein